MRVCVFCGSRAGRAGDLDAATELGRALAQRGDHVVYGGAAIGLMGALAAAALEAGGLVSGILPSVLSGREVASERLTDLRVVDTFAERKAALIESAEAFFVLPGGVGTLDELAEVFVLAHLGLTSTPVIVVNIDGFYDPLADLLANMASSGFVDPATTARVSFPPDVQAALLQLDQHFADVRIELSIELDAPAAVIWSMLTEPSLTPRWLFGTSIESSLRPGDPYAFRTADGSDALVGTLRSVEPPWLLEMTFSAVHAIALAAEAPSLLRWRLFPRGTKTAVQLVHEELARSPATAARAASDWPVALEGLQRLAESFRGADSWR